MTYILTLIASAPPLPPAALEHAALFLGVDVNPVWLAPGKAADLKLSGKPGRNQIEALWTMLEDGRIDLFVTEGQNRRKKLLLADMDATIVTGETLDELAAHAGLRDKIAAITARAMRGELDFKAALRERVGLLRGLPQQALEETLAKTTLSPGAESFVRSMETQGAIAVLVSGGFTFFTGPIAAKTGFQHHHGNTLEIAHGQLTGTVAEPILDKDAKLNLLQQYQAELKLYPSQTLAIGDGANDLPMLQAAGLGIGYQPKPLVRDKIDNCIFYGDLTAALYAQGYSEADISG